tara:strand:- start:748 stop:978 length:231 start_codon:yes stop_codon:yes gene_type:complete
MKVKFYIPTERAIEILINLENEDYEAIGYDDIYIEPPFLVDCIEVFLNSKVARNFLPKPIVSPWWVNLNSPNELPF